MSISERLRSPAAAVLVGVLVGCAPGQPEPSPSPTASQPPAAQEPMTVGVQIGDEFRFGHAYGRIATDWPLESLHPQGSLWDAVVSRFVYSGVYRLDDTYAPVPDLAAEPCAVSADLLTVTCRLRGATFHDGTPVTADDVAFTYELLISEACRMAEYCTAMESFWLVGARALDEQMIEFRLSEPDPAFVTTMLPEVLIEPREPIEQAYARFVDEAGHADPEQLAELALRVAPKNEIGAPTCEPVAVKDADDAVVKLAEDLAAEAERVIADTGIDLRSRDEYPGGHGSKNLCEYFLYLGRVLTDASDALSTTGTDAIAASYRILDRPLIPIGSGPWRVASIDPGTSMELTAFEAFHRGTPATPELDVTVLRTTAEAVEAVRTGAVEWLEDPFSGRENFTDEGIADAAGLAWAEYHRLGYYGLHYNMREGRLFADGNLRAAMELCVDKDEAVATATGGTGAPIYSAISPAMWAFEPDLPRPERDVTAARALIEASGWRPGDDGIYEKAGQRLATEIPVLEEQHSWVRFVQLMAFQVADCGIELTLQPINLDEFMATVEWPLIAPGADRQWDAMFSGWQYPADPDMSGIFHSRAIASADNPKGFNYLGYDSAENDALLDRGRATSDLRQRARISREHQRLMAEDRPVLFGWSAWERDPRTERLQSSAGPLGTDSSHWWWQLETLYLRPEGA